jgi:hypothetical protein
MWMFHGSLSQKIPSSRPVSSPRSPAQAASTLSHFSNEVLNDSLLTDTQARHFYEHIFRIQTHAEPTTVLVGPPKRSYHSKWQGRGML